MSLPDKLKVWRCKANDIWEVMFISNNGNLVYGRGVYQGPAHDMDRLLTHMDHCNMLHIAPAGMYAEFAKRRDASDLTKVPL